MDNLALGMKIIQSQKESFEYKSHDWNRKSSNRISMKESQHTLPQRGVHQTSMLPVWPINIERVKQ